ncbi:MAG TPA: 50S ribosomal protein L21 [Thermoguttaceae bacterium]|nr:50S ribosomal protein L21 [Thermoguttaceae bacterium]
MYAIIEEAGHQWKVEEGQELRINWRDVEPGDTITFDRVLACRDDDGFRLGRPTVDGAAVTAEVLGDEKGPKLVVQKFRRRKTYRKKTGHRQLYTSVQIKKINVG